MATGQLPRSAPSRPPHTQPFATGRPDRATTLGLGSRAATGTGADTTVLAFVQPHYPAWYRLWVDHATGRIRRLEMRTKGHVMDQTYQAYDEAVTITPPPPAQPRA